MTTHCLQLATQPFEAIISGKKTIESRLFDEKRQKIMIGDEIVFTNRENIEQTVGVKVINLYHDKTFHDLFTRIGPAKFGGESVAWLDNQIREFYSEADQRKNGVLGIEFELIS
ncbi:MAG TPA: ASCH domain-containing protein [Patescibacteria group bacterium]|nr:ASCH domain-containing protein [Patescibacteria group bacterium]